MKFLEESSQLGANHPAVKQYNKCMRGAGDTVRSIIISANSRLAFLENKQVLRLLSKDELNLSDIDLFSSVEKREKQMKMDSAVDEIRRRFGFYSIQRGLMYRDRILSAVNAKEEHTVHPHGYFSG